MEVLKWNELISIVMILTFLTISITGLTHSVIIGLKGLNKFWNVRIFASKPLKAVIFYKRLLVNITEPCLFLNCYYLQIRSLFRLRIRLTLYTIQHVYFFSIVTYLLLLMGLSYFVCRCQNQGGVMPVLSSFKTAVKVWYTTM